jgi:hypothetical protein
VDLPCTAPSPPVPIPLLPLCRPAPRPRYRVGLTYPDPSYPTQHQRCRVGHRVRPTLQDLPCITYPTTPCPPAHKTGSADLPYTAPRPSISTPAAQGSRPALRGLPYGVTWGPRLPTPHRAARPRRDQDRNCRPTLHTPRGGHSRPRRGALQHHHRGPSSPLYSSDPTRAEARRSV